MPLFENHDNHNLYTFLLFLLNYLLCYYYILDNTAVRNVNTSNAQGSLAKTQTTVDINLSGGLTADITMTGYVFDNKNGTFTGEIYAGERGVV